MHYKRRNNWKLKVTLESVLTDIRQRPSVISVSVALFTDIGCTSKELCSQRSIYLNILRNKTASLDFLIRNKLERRNLCKTNKIYEKKGNSHSIFTLILFLLVLPFFTSSLSKIHFPVPVIKFKQYHYLYLSLNIHFQPRNKPIILKSTYLISWMNLSSILIH